MSSETVSPSETVGRDDSVGRSEAVGRTGTERLIEAGAIVGAGASGDTVDAITARRYRHPALAERVVVTLVPGTLGPAEDLALEFLGFEPAAEPVVVGAGRRQALGFPAWAVINDPVNGHHALALVKDIERLARVAKSKPGQAKDGFDALGERLGRAVPHFLPTFYEQAGRAFVAADNRQTAAIMFGRARDAERVHALAIDEDRQRDVFLEFAFSGALTAKSLTQHAKNLALRAEPAAAFELFLRICLERVAGGLPPYGGMADDLRRLARAAKLPLPAQDERVIAALLDSPALPHAPLAFWKAYAPALTRLAKVDVAVRARLLDLLPVPEQDGFDTLWLDLLEATGAVAGLVEVHDAPAVARPRDGAAGWLSRAVRWHARGWRRSHRSARLQDLVRAMAPRLRAEAVALDLLDDRAWKADLDLLDLCLDLGLTVSEPADSADIGPLPLDRWLQDENPGRRDLSALAGAGWARDALLAGLGQVLRSSSGYYRQAEGDMLVDRARVQVLLAGAGTRQLLATWLERLADMADSGALPGLETALDRLAPAAHDIVLGAAPAASARLAGIDVGRALARTLRIGLLDELGWPALEQAVAEYPAPAPPTPPPGYAAGSLPPRYSVPEVQYRIENAWPELVLANQARVTVVGPDQVLLRHDVRIPPSRPASHGGGVTAEYVDGQVLVGWYSPAGSAGYWSDHPDEVFDLPDDRVQRWTSQADGLPLPGGGRTRGGRPLRPGDTTVASARAVVSDGEHWWRWADSGWQEYDPDTGDGGRRSRPAFFEAGLAPEGATPLDGRGRLAPVPAGLEGSPLGAAGGLLGWRAVQLPDGSRLGESVAGAVVTMSAELVRQLNGATPAAALQFPGGPPVGVLAGNAGVYLAAGDLAGSRLRAGEINQAYARGTALVPPVDHWHALRPRDEPGSAVLRAITDTQARALLAAARKVSTATALERTVRQVLPGITDARLVAGVAGVLAIARARAGQLQALPAPAAAPAPVRVEPAAGPAEPVLTDGLLAEALAGLTGAGAWRSSSFGRNDSARDSLRAAVALVRTPPKKGLLARIGLVRDQAESHDLPGSSVEWTVVVGGLGAIVLRAAGAATPEPERRALVALLAAVQDTPLAEPDGTWREVTLTAAQDARSAPGTVLPTAGGQAVVIDLANSWSRDGTQTLRALEHSPGGTFGAVPGYVVTASRPSSGWGGASRIAELLELIRTRGPVPWHPEAVDALVAATGISRAEAALLLAGLPGGRTWEHNFLDKHTRETIGLKVAEASAAQPTLREIGTADRLALLGLAVPQRPAGLWESGPDVAALAAGWVQRFGRRAPVPEVVIAEMSAAMSNISGRLAPASLLQGLADPAGAAWLSQDRTWVIKEHRLVGPGDGFSGPALVSTVTALVWLAYRLAEDDPFRARLAPAQAMLMERLANPHLLLPMLSGTDLGGLRQAYGHPAVVPDPVTGRRPPVTLDLGPVGVIVDESWGDVLYLRPSGLSGPDDPLLRIGEGRSDLTSAALRAVLDPGFARLLAVPDSGPGPDFGPGPGSGSGPGAGLVRAPGAGPRWVQDPLVSAPELVPQVCERLGVGADAARLYLQLLALPDPSDKNVHRWNGWTAKQLKPATDALRAAGLVVDGKRSRSGRTAFLPSGWLDLKAPYPPIEVWKVDLLGLLPDGRGPLGVSVPTVPVGELFGAAWQRVLDGNGPQLEQFESRRR